MMGESCGQAGLIVLLKAEAGSWWLLGLNRYKIQQNALKEWGGK